MDPVKRKITFKIPLKELNGFNSTQQHDLFNEKLFETRQFPDVTFTGKLPADFSELKSGMQNVFVTGMLTMHGVQHERTIQLHLFMADQLLVAQLNFGIQLKDHSIEIPRSQAKEIATEIKIEVKAMMRMKLGKEDSSSLLDN
jgi:polyisoprenoid-binding protein YceI